MSLNLSSLLKLSVAGAVLITLGACKPSDKGQGALKSKSIAALNLSKTESNVFAKYFATNPCSVEEMEGLGALAGLGLGESGTSGVTFASREFDGGLVTYRDLEMRESDSEKPAFSAKSVVFHCPQMGEDDPTFDRVDLTDVVIFDKDEDVEFTAKTLNIASPTFEAARAVVENMTKAEPNTMNDIGFGAMSLTGAVIKSDDVNGTLNSMSWGETRGQSGQGKADFTLKDLKLQVPGDDGTQDMSLNFGGMSARNVNIGGRIKSGAPMSQSLESLIGNLNAFEKPYDELLIDRMQIDAEGFSVDFGGIEGRTTEKSGVITTRQKLKPTKIQIKPAMGENPSLKRNYDILKSLNFETINMSGNSTTTLDKADDSISVSDGLFIIDDALRINFEYEAEGLDDMTKKMKTAMAANTSPDMMENYEALKLRNFRLTLEDNSIVARGLKLATEMTGQSEKNLKRSLGMAVFAAALAAENEVQAEVYSETMEAFASFVKDGGTLTIEANPPAPFSLAPLITGKGEDFDPEALGFSASQESPAE